jgi:hypothetical protein
MGLIVRALARKNILAVIVGVLLAGAPLLAFDFWLGGLVDRQGQDEVETCARHRARRLSRHASDRHARRSGGARRG